LGKRGDCLPICLAAGSSSNMPARQDRQRRVILKLSLVVRMIEK
jgi:hypothetical protein